MHTAWSEVDLITCTSKLCGPLHVCVGVDLKLRPRSAAKKEQREARERLFCAIKLLSDLASTKRRKNGQNGFFVFLGNLFKCDTG